MNKFEHIKGMDAPYPFIGYKIYTTFDKTGGRVKVMLIPKKEYKNSLKRTIMQYARYIMCIHEKRILRKNEEVDHIDGDKTNDDISNLQILSGKDHRRKTAKEKGKLCVVFRCPSCRKYYEKPKRETHLIKGGIYTACSKKCARKFQTMYLQNPFSDKVEKRLEENIVMEYQNNWY